MPPGIETTPAEVQEAQENEETKVEETEKPKDESEVEDEAETVEDLSESERDEANRLYKALKDPRTAGPLVAALAQQAGLSLSPLSTKEEVKETKSSIRDIVAKSLGDSYKFLAPQIGEALENAFKSYSESQDARFNELVQAQIERDVRDEYNKLNRETKGESKKLEPQMARLAEEMPIGKQDVATYIRRLYRVALADSEKSDARRTAERIRRNASDVPARLRATATGETEQIKVPDKKMTLNESIQFAMDQAARK